MIIQIKEEFAKVISKKYKLDLDQVIYSFSYPKEEFGDLATNVAFIISKREKKNPKEIAQDISKMFEENKWISKVNVMGPYINLFLSDEFYKNSTKEAIKEKEGFGSGKKKKEKVVVEFFHANTHKGTHIGHIRNITTGEAISKILEFGGKKVVRVNYQGDIGPHVAKCLWGYINLYNKKAPKENRGVWLGKVYAESSKKIKENEKLQEEVQEINNKLYSKDPEIVKIWKETRKWCLDDFDKFYKEYGVKYDEFYFESQTESIGKEIVLENYKRGVLEKSDGAIILNLEDKGLGVYLLLTSKGNPLYSTKDVGLARIKFDKYKPDKSIHVVGKEQELYFKQLFETFKAIGFIDAAKKSHHLIYELVMLPEGKMSSRDGTMILYSDLKNRLLETSRKETLKRHEDWKEEDVEKVAKKITFAALKFSMLKREFNKQIIFEWDKALSLEGDSGPYLQYAYVRTKGITKKTKTKPKLHSKYEFNKDEKRLVRKISQFREIVKKSSENLIIHNLTDYLIELAADFNKFYANSPVLKAENEKTKETRLAIVEATSIVIKNGLKLLGIECPEKM